MSDVNLTLCMADYDRTRALIDGSVKPERINLRYIVSPPSETFWRMLKFNQYDASEMSLSSLLIARLQGRPWTAIPIFPFRSFFHTTVLVRTDSGIKEPGDLKGKTFGLPEYQVTAAVWTRGVLEHDFDVKPASVKWYAERPLKMSHGGETGFKAPEGVSIQHIPETESMASLLLSGEIDAALTSPYAGMRSMLNRTDYLELIKSPKIRPLFEDPVQEGVRFYKKHGFSHINHVTIIQNSVVEKHPWAPSSLFAAFEKAKQKCYENIDHVMRSSLIFAALHLNDQRRIFGEDPYPYGLRANRDALKTLVSYSFEQGLITQETDPGELFDGSTLAT